MTTRRPKTPKRKRRKTTGEAASRRSAAHLQKQLDRRTRELAKARKLLKEALQQQSATSEVLQVINSSTVELASVFDAMLKRAMRLCEAAFGGLWVFEGDRYVAQALCGVPPAYASYLRNMNLVPGPHTAPYRFLQGERSAIQNVDLAAEEPYLTGDPQRRALVDLGGARAALQVPLLRDELVLGVITVYRQEVRPFSEQQVTLLQNFADQAVIAIENARLFNETQEALERQTATAEILKVIASSPSDVQPVFDAIASSATRLIGGFSSTVILFIDGVAHLKALTSTTPEADEILKSVFPRPTADFPPFQNARIGEIEQIADTEVMPNELRDLARARGYRSVVFAPLENKGALIGVIGVTRVQPGPFSEHHLQLLRTFADQAVIAIENTRLFNEVQAKTRDLSESLQQQTATADVLKVISRSAFDLQTVLDALLTSACQLCEADIGTIRYEDGENYQLAATYGCKPEWIRHFSGYSAKPDQSSVFGQTIIGGRTVHMPDVLADPNYRRPEAQKLMGFRAALGVPLIREGHTFGVINLFRFAVGSFEPRQIEIVETFADQAVIAIENVRLFDEVQARTRDLTEALTYQTGSANILKVIASSPTDVAPVLQAIVESACELCGAYDALVRLKNGDGLAFGAHHGPLPVSLDSVPFTENSTAGLAMIKRRPVHVHDLHSADGDRFPHAQELARSHGERTILSVPLIREGESIGAIVLRRTEVHPFSDKQIALLQTFADQAVIAIENARLFNETQEALERQTATAEVLNVINSSPGDLAPVFETILEKAHSLCGVSYGSLQLYDGEKFRAVAAHGIAEAFADRLRQGFVPGPNHPSQQLMQGGRFAQVPDCAEINDPIVRAAFELGGIRTVLFIPLRKEDRLLGQIAAARRDVSSFTEKEISLLENFAAQAVIAIENARLLNETAETLERQTATADILKVIASSPDDVRPVFEAIAQRSKVLVDALSTTVFTLMNGAMHLQAFTPTNRQADTTLQAMFPAALSSFSWGESIRRGEMFCVADTDREPINLREIAQLRGFRSMLLVPLLREQRPIGLISVTRVEPGPFSNHHVQLLQSFADQAVIAIQNVKLFEEVQARTFDLQESLEQQTATSEVLQVISSSSGELDPVFNKMLENATRICGARFGTMTLYEDGGFRTVALYNAPKAYADTQFYKVIRPHPESGLSAVQRTRKPVYIADIRKEPPYVEGNANVRALADLGGARTIIIVPMLRDNELVGTITIYRQEVKPFTDKQTELVSHFANQAVIAIENARLLNELRERTEELSRSLEDLRTAQDRLVQTEKLASLGQLTAGIAHEIKNPLNFVNNFSALSAELVDEMTDVFENPALDEANRRKELDEIRDLLKSNLEKVVQHGKRADSIVKNMLLHSREGSGELRAADINGLVEESLNLAYHGARAEKSGFNITLQRQFDATAGEAELFPQEITRALLNLISNGFYAATKRKSENGEEGFEPTLSATTRNLGASVEIRIRDNGTGIPADVKEKIFNPFFTTKPAGEGTGLGLSMTHDIIVKQHGGTITVDTKLGAFTEFVITLPRATGAQTQRSVN